MRLKMYTRISGVVRILLQGGGVAHGFGSSWWQSHPEVKAISLDLQKRIWLKFFATTCHSNWWLWRSNFELTELGRKISTAIVWTAAKFACIRKLQGARALVPHGWWRHWREWHTTSVLSPRWERLCHFNGSSIISLYSTWHGVGGPIVLSW